MEIADEFTPVSVAKIEERRHLIMDSSIPENQASSSLSNLLKATVLWGLMGSGTAEQQMRPCKWSDYCTMVGLCMGTFVSRQPWEPERETQNVILLNCDWAGLKGVTTYPHNINKQTVELMTGHEVEH